MESRLIETIVCPACGIELPASATVCPRCRNATAVRSSVERPLTDVRPSLLDRPWFIIGLLFLVTAILGLPLLWVSRGFTRPWKVMLSVAVTLYTAVLLWGFGLIMQWSWSRILDSLR